MDRLIELLTEQLDRITATTRVRHFVVDPEKENLLNSIRHDYNSERFAVKRLMLFIRQNLEQLDQEYLQILTDEITFRVNVMTKIAEKCDYLFLKEE